MKNLLLSLLCCFFLSAANAQITFEHTYPDNGYMQPVLIEGEGMKYCGLDSTKKEFRMYNVDHTLWKKIVIATIPGHTVTGWSYPSKYLFNSDSKVEVAISFSGPAPTYHYQVDIISENGYSNFTFNNAYTTTVYNTPSGTKCLAMCYVYTGASTAANVFTTVYSLPGQYAGQVKVPNLSTGDQSTLYPNPMENAATLRYSLPTGTNNGTVTVLSGSGAVIRTYPISNQSGELMIERGTLPSGVYFYRTEFPGYTSQQQSFIVR